MAMPPAPALKTAPRGVELSAGERSSGARADAGRTREVRGVEGCWTWSTAAAALSFPAGVEGAVG